MRRTLNIILYRWHSCVYRCFMAVHKEKRIVPYTPAQMFDLVAAVNRYPEFLPWCVASRITQRDGDVFYADLVIGYRMIREKFSSRVTALRPDHIHVEYISGPMKHLSNHWRFLDNGDGTSTIDFYVEFDFKNSVLRKIVEMFFNEAIKRMVHAFENRAKELYSFLPADKISNSNNTLLGN